MIKKFTLAFLLSGLCFLAYTFTHNTVQSNNDSAPPKYTGSPGDAQNCTSCHNGSPTNVTGWITSDIPAAGYTPDTTYTITATATDSSTNKFGFEISPQLTSGNPLGAKVGMLFVINNTETILVSTTGTGDTKYITQRAAGTTGAGNSKTWTFNWQAPSVQPKSVTFYGAFTAGISISSDHTYLSEHTREVNLSGLDETAFTEALGLTIYSNPAGSVINISLFHEQPATLNIKLFDLSGKMVKSLISDQKFSGDFTQCFSLDELKKGLYFLNVEINGKSCYKKVIIS